VGVFALNSKGFFSIVTATVSVMLLLFLAGAVFSMRGSQETGSADLSAKIVSDHLADSVKFYNETAIDALLDAAYADLACKNLQSEDPCLANSNSVFNTTLRTYASRSFQNLSSPSLSSNYSFFNWTSCTDEGIESIFNGAIWENMRKFSIEARVVIGVNNSQAKIRNYSVPLRFRLYSFYAGPNIYHRFRVTDQAGATYLTSKEYYHIRLSCT